MTQAATWLLPLVPSRLGYALCDRIGGVAPRLPFWTAVVDNMRHVQPTAADDEINALARGVVVHIFKNYFDLLRAGRTTTAELRRRYRIEGLANGLLALQAGRGALVVTLHTGSYSLASAPIAHALNINILLIVEQMTNPGLHVVLNTLRRRPRVAVEAVDRDIGRHILRVLKGGDAAILAQDRLVVQGSTRVSFFGQAVNVPNGAATLALRTGAPLVPVYVARRPDNGARVVIDPPIVPARDGSPTARIECTTQALIHVLEGYIRSDPSQWVLTNAVWR